MKMKIINKINIKVLLTVYLLINLANFHRIGYMSSFALMCGQVLDETTTINHILFYSCISYAIIIHVALITTLVFVFKNKFKPFVVVSVVDFIIYAIMAFSMEFILPFSIVILIPHLLILSFVLYVYKKKQKNISQSILYN